MLTQQLSFHKNFYINLSLLDEDGPGQMVEIREVHMLDPWWSFIIRALTEQKIMHMRT